MRLGEVFSTVFVEIFSNDEGNGKEYVTRK